MKFLVLSDLHGADVKIDALMESSPPDVIILPGDIPSSIDLPVLLLTLLQRGRREDYVRNIYERFYERLTFLQIRTAKKILNSLLKFDVPIIAIHGNTETRETRQWLSLFSHRYDQLKWISDSFTKYEDVLFVGHGWTQINPEESRARTPGDLEAEFAKTVLLDTFGRAKQHSDLTVLVSHAPPYNTPIDYLPHKKIHAGSIAVRDMLDSGYFDLAITGHLHEAFGSYLSPLGWWAINAGAAVENLGCFIDTDERTLNWIRNINPKPSISKLIYRNRVALNYDSKNMNA